MEWQPAAQWPSRWLIGAGARSLAGGARPPLRRFDTAGASEDVQIMPRYPANVTQPDIRTTLLGSQAAMPIFVPPMAAHGLAHPSAQRPPAAPPSCSRWTWNGRATATRPAYRLYLSRLAGFSEPAECEIRRDAGRVVQGVQAQSGFQRHRVHPQGIRPAGRRQGHSVAGECEGVRRARRVCD
jgi:hypothetical protein